MGLQRVGHNLATDHARIVSYDPLYFCGVHCNFSFFISNLIDLSTLSFFLDQSGQKFINFVYLFKDKLGVITVLYFKKMELTNWLKVTNKLFVHSVHAQSCLTL